MRSNDIVFQPHVYRSFMQGVRQVVGSLRPTLGPTPRTTVIDHLSGHKPPEILDDGGIIARRIYQLPDRDADVGAMFLRHMLSELHRTVGDGTASAAVIFDSVLAEGLRYLEAGIDPMRLRGYLEHGLHIADRALAALSRPVSDKRDLEQVAATLCQDEKLAVALADAFEALGQYGQLDLREGGDAGAVEFVDGTYWEFGLLAPKIAVDRQFSGDEAAILISDLELDDPVELATFIAQAIREDIRTLVLIVNRLSERAVGVLNFTNSKNRMQIVAIQPPFAEVNRRMAALEDLAILTGGQVFIRDSGQKLASVRISQLGRAQHFWADKRLAGFVNGAGDPGKVQARLDDLCAAYEAATDPDRRLALRDRIGKFLGGSATVLLGAGTASALEWRKAQAARTAETLRSAIAEGVVNGGGVAFLACRGALQEMAAHAVEPEAKAACQILYRALSEPFQTVLRNAGHEPGCWLSGIEQAGYRLVFDARTGSLSEPVILDSTKVQRAILQHSVRSAALALTVEVVVHRRQYTTDQPVGNA